VSGSELRAGELAIVGDASLTAPLSILLCWPTASGAVTHEPALRIWNDAVSAEPRWTSTSTPFRLRQAFDIRRPRQRRRTPFLPQRRDQRALRIDRRFIGNRTAVTTSFDFHC